LIDNYFFIWSERFMKKKALSLLAQRLREERIKHRWSQQELADRLGTTIVTISRWENGASIPSPYYRLKLGQLFGTDFQQLDWISGEEVQAESADKPLPEETTPMLAESSQQEAVITPEVPALSEEKTTPTEEREEAKPLPATKDGVVARRRILIGSLSGTATLLLGGGSWFFLTQLQSKRISQTAHPPVVPTITTQYVYSTAPHTNNAVNWSSHGHFLVCAIGDETVRVLEATTGNLLMVYRQHTSFVDDAGWSPDETRVVSGGGDTTAQVWKAATGERLLTYKGHHSSVVCISWSHDGTRIVSGGRDTTVQVWDAFTAKHLVTYKGHSASVWNALWSPDDQSVVSSGEDGTIQIWDPDTAEKSRTFIYQGGNSRINCTDWSPNGTQIVSSHVDGIVRIWDALNGSSILTYSGHTSSVIFVRWSPDSTTIASGDVGGNVHIWNVSTGQKIAFYKMQHEIYALTWAPDSHHLAIANKDGTLAVCKLYF
jgi:transcriptional regulator with XRE-family HTH domain